MQKRIIATDWEIEKSESEVVKSHEFMITKSRGYFKMFKCYKWYLNWGKVTWKVTQLFSSVKVQKNGLFAVSMSLWRLKEKDTSSQRTLKKVTEQ